MPLKWPKDSLLGVTDTLIKLKCDLLVQFGLCRMNEIGVTDKVDCKIIGQVGQLFSAICNIMTFRMAPNGIIL